MANKGLIDPVKGGTTMVIHGVVTRVDSITDEKTGEEKNMVYVEFWGGNKYLVTPKGSDFDKLKVGQSVEVHQSYSFGKNGARPSGNPVLVEAKASA